MARDRAIPANSTEFHASSRTFRSYPEKFRSYPEKFEPKALFFGSQRIPVLRHVSPPVLPVAGVDCLQEEAPVVGQSVGLPACRLYHAVRALDPTADMGSPACATIPTACPPSSLRTTRSGGPRSRGTANRRRRPAPPSRPRRSSASCQFELSKKGALRRF